ncbi:MAG: hypothetical protein ABIQ73_16445 [Acidimicrobiales bacterium]
MATGAAALGSTGVNGAPVAQAGADEPLRRWLFLLAAIVAAVASIGIPAHATYGARVTADEPQYLLTALSLGRQFDLDISDEIALEQYRSFHKVDLDRQTQPFADGRELSPHDPLLPLLLAVPMRWGGWVAAKAFIVALAAVLSALTAWVAVRRFAVRPEIALPVVGIFFCSAPLATYASQVYPEIAAALATTVAIAAISATPGSRDTALRNAALLVVSVSALPWLSVKYVPVAAALALLGLYRSRRHRSMAAGIAIAFAAMAIAYVVAHRLLYGGWTAYASGDYFAERGESRVIGTSPNYVGRSRRVLGLLVDRGFGLAAWAPVWLFAPCAFAALTRRRAEGRWWLVLPVAAGWFVATFVALTMHGWWWPGRQVVVILPLVVIAVAWAVDQFRVLVGPLVMAGALGFATWCYTAFEAATRRRTLVVDFERTSNPWYRVWRVLLPDGRAAGPGTDIRTALWWLVIAVVVVVGVRMSRPPRQPQPIDRSLDQREAVPEPNSVRSAGSLQLDRVTLDNL